VKNLVAVLLVSANAGAAGCAPRYVNSNAPLPLNVSLPQSTITNHVLVISVDGLRPDAIGERETPILSRMMRSGSYSLKATTIMPSNTLPSHTSMLTGESPDRHHVLWNNAPSARFDTVEVPTIFGVARARGYRTAAFFSKAKFHTLQREGTLDYSQAPGGWFGKWTSQRTVRDVERYLEVASPNLLFVHLGDADTAGHESGWMTDPYRVAVGVADAAIGRLLAAADDAFGSGNYSVIVSADHGGHAKGHGTAAAIDVTIPWIAWGRGVRPVELSSVSIKTMDTASTVLWMLGLPEPTDWAGTPIVDAFLPRAGAPATIPAARLEIP
jgi:arylsulfatase A-like enzyme